MIMKTMTFALTAGLLAASSAFAQQASLLSTNIDTWVEGTVLSLDADGQKFSVRGVKLPFASVEAQMTADIASKTKDIQDAQQKQAKAAEVQKSWQDKLNKAKTEQVASSPSDFNLVLPDKANLVVMREKDLSAAQDPNHAVAQVTSSSSSSSSSVSANGQGTVSASANASPGQASAYSNKEMIALKSLKDLKIGDKVKVGFDSGLISNTAYMVLEEGTAVK
jgi:hypothetical protein